MHSSQGLDLGLLRLEARCMEGYRNLLSEDCLGSAETLQGLVRYVQSPAPLSDRNCLLVKGWGVGN
jgi:hypothetical protein